MIRLIAILACVLTVAVTAASAFIRHSQAGLGCEPWPSCYRQAAPTGAKGQAAPASAQGAAEPASAQGAAARAGAGAAIDEAPFAVIVVRALHRVSAVAVGILALGLVLFGWVRFDAAERVAASLAIVDVVALSWLGRFTPHDLPLVTIGNVVGGFALAAAFGWIAARPADRAGAAKVARSPGAALAVLAIVSLGLLACAGVMISARHAIDACGAALCVAGARFDHTAFDPLTVAPRIDAAAAQAMHVAHRAGALLFIGLTLALAIRLRRQGAATPSAALAVLVGLQVLAGLATALGGAPLLAGVAHNAVAATLAIVLAGLARHLAAPVARAAAFA